MTISISKTSICATDLKLTHIGHYADQFPLEVSLEDKAKGTVSIVLSETQ